MPMYRMNGPDVFHNQPREFYVEGPDRASAEELLRARGIDVREVIEVEAAARPKDSTLLRVPAPPGPAMPRARRRVILMICGVGLAFVLIGGYLFVWKAKEHLTREKPSQREDANKTAAAPLATPTSTPPAPAPKP